MNVEKEKESEDVLEEEEEEEDTEVREETRVWLTKDDEDNVHTSLTRTCSGSPLGHLGDIIAG